MGETETRAEVDRILEASLGELIQQHSPSDRGTGELMDWRVPEQGRVALGKFGLPPERSDDLLGVIGALQESAEPQQGPDGRQVYVLGSYGSSRLVALEESGEVLALRSGAQVHPDLAHLHPDGIPTVMVNSTIAGFVGCAWRWHFVLPLLAAEQERAGQAEIAAWREGRTGDDMPDPYAAYQQICQRVLTRFRDIDPVIGDDAAFWVDVIVDVS